MNTARALTLLIGLGLVSGCGDELGDGSLHQIPTDGLSEVASGCEGEACAVAWETRCAPEGGVSLCVEVGACLRWSTPEACAEGARCLAGACAEGCPGEPCDTVGLLRCDPLSVGTVLVCDDHDGGGCLDWGPAATCPTDTVCSAGQCVDTCSDACVAGESRCEGDAAATCTVGPLGCLRWGPAIVCPEGCAMGQCVGPCEDECAEEGTSGCHLGGVTACVEDARGCLLWGPPAPCPEEETCHAGACAPMCADACPAPGATRCEGARQSTCGPREDAPCLGWGVAQDCPAGGVCAGAACAAGCEDPCAALGLRDCAGHVARECADLGGCLVWTERVDCAATGQLCAAGDCASACDDVCDAGATRCDPAGAAVERCEHAGGCLTWVQAVDCAAGGEVCSGGACLGPTPTARPGAFRDVIITEIMADPRTVPAAEGEWFELHNPRTDVTWDLTGCVLLDAGSDAHIIGGPLTIPPGGFAALARGTAPGFIPSYVYANVALDPAHDQVTLGCGGQLIHTVAWSSPLPEGRALSLDPSAFQQAVTAPGDWCPATTLYNGDYGTPGAVNPPCVEAFEQTVATVGSGYCSLSGQWFPFAWTGVPPPTAGGVLDLSWFSAWCENFGVAATLQVELRTGAEWTAAVLAYASATTESCTWLPESAPIAQATLAAARSNTGLVQARFRITSGCPSGFVCTGATGPMPTHCVRNLRLAFNP